MSIHRRIVAYLRDQVSKPGAPCGEYFVDRTDEQVMHTVFMSFRGGGEPKGLRLSPIGLDILSKFFKPFNITLPDGYRIGSADMLWLDARAEWPYYIGFGLDNNGSHKLTVFDHKLGIKLKLADGAISNLREIESF